MDADFETGWVIEAGNEPRYWDGRGPDAFVYDHNEAFRMARREDAERAKAWIVKNHACRVAEHVWLARLSDTPHDAPSPTEEQVNAEAE